MTLLDRAPVRRVREALEAAGADAEVLELVATARTAGDAANSLGIALGAIVKSLVFTIANQPVMALVAGDRQCEQKALPAALGLVGKVGRADADLVREVTGFSIGGVAPIGLAQPLPLAIDASLGRFEKVYAAAGHPHCVFGSTLTELARMTGGEIVDGIAAAPR
jgi:prolyl-tRNA editing enzyme YbaK/EbsC (Cys-tRNA(Pro) deacylase)